MSLTLDIGATGMLAQQLNVDVISNNIANMTTTGYKRQRAEFQDLLYQIKIRPGASSSAQDTKVPAGLQQGLGVKAGSVYRINEQGALQMTGNPFDLSIKGKGYFQVTMPDGDLAYTRDGSFQINQDGDLVTSNGYKIEPSITIPPDAIDVTVNGAGEVLVRLDGQTDLSNVGQLQLATFPNEAGLEAIGDNLLMETEASGAPVVDNPQAQGFGTLQQGALETSNVNIVEEMTSLIQAQRAYEMNSKVISTGDEMLSTITQLR
jgi:flagellar basal-body rod protein FlgG